MEINQITFAYKDKIRRLHDVTTSIKRGEITTILGPNGCGKSTLMGVLTNNHLAQKGSIILNGKEMQAYKAKELAQTLGVVHQKNIAPADMTVEKLVYYGRLPHRKPFALQSDHDEKMVKWALESTGLYDRKDMPLDVLSGGQQQRAWIAMALAQDTPYLFLDEPTANLDIYYQYELLDLVHDLCKNHNLTIVMVLHDINQALQYSDHIIAMKSGEVVASGAPDDIVTPSLIHEVYGVHVVIKEDAELGRFMVPIGVKES